MYCMKCGKETQDNRIFCNECLEHMAHFPVKPDTPVVLPNRLAASARHTPSRYREPPSEAQVARLHHKVHLLFFCVLGLTAALLLTMAALIYTLHNTKQATDIGRNYSIADSAESSTPSADGNVK